MKLPFAKIAIAFAALAAVTYSVVEFRGPYGYSGLMQKREQLHQLEQENRKLKSDLNSLDKRVDSLKNDPAAQELEIRKKLGLVKDGETVYVMQDKANKTAPAK